MRGIQATTAVRGLLTSALVLLVVATASAPAAADGYERLHYRHRHQARIVYASPAEYGVCRIGWWQGLRYGHVRPHWGAWCR